MGYDDYQDDDRCDTAQFELPAFDSQGFDAAGFDANGYDREGYNSVGYDRYGYDAAGLDREGYDRAGFNRYGYDRTGHDRHGVSDPRAAKGDVTVRSVGIGLAAGAVVTVVMTAVATGLVTWLIGKLIGRVPPSVWSQVGAAPQLPSPGSAALVAALAAVCAVAVAVVTTLTLPYAQRVFRGLAVLIAACVVVALASSAEWPTWLSTIVIVGVAASTMIACASAIGPYQTKAVAVQRRR